MFVILLCDIISLLQPQKRGETYKNFHVYGVQTRPTKYNFIEAIVGATITTKVLTLKIIQQNTSEKAFMFHVYNMELIEINSKERAC